MVMSSAEPILPLDASTEFQPGGLETNASSCKRRLYMATSSPGILDGEEKQFWNWTPTKDLVRAAAWNCS